ncbi:WXG100 family type VII secretion target [Mycolicibacterium baixiangningiae]|uniref:WXG100 family type VII secretion target n=1 Tax=Mycolicibacterium baixiangningiae TaxID=2761578 RepID=UPI001867278E|nr:WXG100 family type VII secretion target [Mycolicibacterium baixiangningiae]
MGQSVEVVVSELDSAASRLADAGQRLQDGLSGVDLEVDQLLGSGWKGGAASAFGTEWEKWHSGAGQVVRGLQTMSQWLTVAAKEYAKTDEQAAGALGSSMQDPGGSGAPAAGGAAGGGAAAWQSADGAASSQRGTADLAQQMNLAPPASAPAASAPAAQLGQFVPTAAQAVQGAAGQSAQAAGGLAQQAAALAQQIVELAQQAGDEKDESEEEPPGDSATLGDLSGSTAPVEPAKPSPERARLLGDQLR